MEAEQTCSSLDNVMLCKSIGAGLNPLICKIGKKKRNKERSINRMMHVHDFYLRVRGLLVFVTLSLLEHGFPLFAPLNVPAHSQHALQ